MMLDTVIGVQDHAGGPEARFHVMYDGEIARVTCGGRLVMSGPPWALTEHVSQTDRAKDAIAKLLSSARPVPPGGAMRVVTVDVPVPAPTPDPEETTPERPLPRRRRGLR